MRLSVLLCTHQPRPDHLAATLAALRAQTFPDRDWELILVDSASTPPLDPATLRLGSNARVVREEKPGLTRARVRAIAEARGEILVFCDDDNLFAPAYLERAVRLFATRTNLGAAGGKSLPRYEEPPPAWFTPFADRLALRDLGDSPLVADWPHDGPREYPSCAPIGAGLILRRAIGLSYARQTGPEPAIPDRIGPALSSGGDCDIVLTALRLGWAAGYFPELRLTHLIPAERLRLGYLARLNHASSESWARLLARHRVSPWTPIPRWTVALRQLRAFWRQRAWRSPAHYFQWAGSCGLLAGRASPG